MKPALRAAIVYFLLVFAAGFLLGTVRTIWLAPITGATLSVLLEIPLMLMWSWIACGLALRWKPVSSMALPRLVMGGTALLLLLIAEAALSLTLGGLTLAQHLASYATAPVLVGLAGQIIFALFPLFQYESPGD